MEETQIKKITSYLAISFLVILFSSCATTRKTKYFQDIPDSGKSKTIYKAKFTEPRIEVGDILTVLVQTADPQTSAQINAGNISNNSLPPSVILATTPNSPISNLNASLGYLVDQNGNITISVLGIIKVANLTTKEAEKVIFDVANSYFKNSTVIVRFANFRVSIEGEVAKPGTYLITNEKVNILEAISMAGDLTIYGKRDNVLLIREMPDGNSITYRINLKKTDFMSAPYFYLKQNDYLYIEPGKGKAASTDVAQARTYTIIGSFLSVLIVLFTYKRF